MEQFLQKYFPSFAPIFVLAVSVMCVFISLSTFGLGILNNMTIDGPVQRVHLESALVYGIIAFVTSSIATWGFFKKGLIWPVIITGIILIFSGQLVYSDWKSLQICAPQEFFCN
jgi:hypothetical protein